MVNFNQAPVSTLQRKQELMRSFFSTFSFLISVFTASSLLAQVDSWPQVRGPDGQGIVSNVSLPMEWSE